MKKFSTHPLFSTRHDIIDNNALTNFKFNDILNQEFNFIKAKFMAYTDNGFPEELDEDYKIYYDAIQFSKSGELLESCLLYTSPSPRDAHESRMPSSA